LSPLLSVGMIGMLWMVDPASDHTVGGDVWRSRAGYRVTALRGRDGVHRQPDYRRCLSNGPAEDFAGSARIAPVRKPAIIGRLGSAIEAAVEDAAVQVAPT
jgi:hypothetical protein